MGDQDSTTIRISRATWQRLHDRKEPGDTHDDVVQELLEEVGDRSQILEEQ